MSEPASQTLSFSSPEEGEELQRAELYGLLARLWFAPPDEPLLQQFAVAVTEAPEAGAWLEEPWRQLVGEMRSMSLADATAEFVALFQGAGKAEVLPYGSWHLAGALNERPLVDMRTDIAALGLTHAAPEGETEDHIAFLFEVMRYLIAGDDLSVCNLEQQRRFFRAHIQPWVGPGLCDAVEQHPQARLYAALARMTRAFIEVETQGFDLIE
ncbi:MAG: molecular chaperone TorD family protein [Rubrivivax sp.]|nr:molecular chaperone TorD family protein [Rubrivivax sp.]